MQARYALSEIKMALKAELAEALNENQADAEVEILEMSAADEIYSARGRFKFQQDNPETLDRSGTFEIVLNERLKAINLKITENQQ